MENVALAVRVWCVIDCSLRRIAVIEKVVGEVTTQLFVRHLPLYFVSIDHHEFGVQQHAREQVARVMLSQVTHTDDPSHSVTTPISYLKMKHEVSITFQSRSFLPREDYLEVFFVVCDLTTFLQARLQLQAGGAQLVHHVEAEDG